MNSNAKATELAKQGEGAVHGAWLFTFAPAALADTKGRDTTFHLSTYQGQVLGALGVAGFKYETLEYMLASSDLEEV